jgi:ketosteroid isomerase-like protein
MLSNREIAGELYAAFAAGDRHRLVELLHPEFRGHVSKGMPGNVGGSHSGPVAMLRDVWIPAARRFAARPIPEQFLGCGNGEIVVLGHYHGKPPGGSRSFDAAFAHVLTFADGQISQLRQITDTRQWAAALDSTNIGVVQRLFEAVTRRDATTLLDTYAPDVVIDEPAFLPYGGIYHGHEGALQHAKGFIATWDALQTLQDREMHPKIAVAGEEIIVQWRLTATAPTGLHLDLPVVDVISLHAGRATSLRMFHADPTATRRFLETTVTSAKGPHE